MSIDYPLSMPTVPAPRSIEWRPLAAVAALVSPFTLHQQVQAHQGQMWDARVSYPRMAETTAHQWIALVLKLNGRQGTFLFGDSVRKTPYGLGGSPVVDGAAQTGQSLLTRGWPPSTNGLLIGGMDWIQIGGSLVDQPFSGVATWNTDVWVSARASSSVTLSFSDPCPSGGGFVHWGVGMSSGIQSVVAGAMSIAINHNVAGSVARLYKVLNDVNSDGSGTAAIDIWPRLRESPDDGVALVLENCKGTFRLKDNLMDFDVDFAKRFGFELDIVEAI